MHRWIGAALVLLLVAGCAALAQQQWQQRYGKPLPPPARELVTPLAGYQEPEYQRDIKPIFEKRCVVCHGCYDAPCQLKLTAFSGVERGASQEKVYNGTRLFADDLSRLFVDARSADEWRQRNFYPVLNEYRQDEETNLNASTLYRMLELKRQHPLPAQGPLPSSFDFSLDREQQCPRVETFDQFAKDYPLWGMPFGFPGIDDVDFERIKRWLETGAKVAPPPPLATSLQHTVERWENFFNGDDLKTQLMSRYIYEHLYLGDVFFSGVDNAQFFSLVRSRTPPGQRVEMIATRRPFDDPQVSRVYYRLVPIRSTLLVKSHMPYALNAERMAKWSEWFLRDVGAITALPSYTPEVASNPFKAFRDIPVRSRYRFMLDEAQFTIMGFIKGPVCRGQVALNVINDQFWVAFIDPDLPEVEREGALLDRESGNLRLPAEDETTTALLNWRKYAHAQTQFLQAKAQFFDGELERNGGTELAHIWNGDGVNRNAALTVFRHFDSATVVKGFVGEPPKTAWIVGYSLLERIHYLLVAGFDVYGNVGHQLMTRMYMDFLRMEGESNFLAFLPKSARAAESQYWYRNVSDEVTQYLYSPRFAIETETAIAYQTDQPKLEFYEKLKNHLGRALSQRWSLGDNTATNPTTNPATNTALQKLEHLRGNALRQLPQLSVISVENHGERKVFTMVHNIGHANVSTLLFEDKQILHDEDSISLVPGILGSYPNMFFDMTEEQLPAFVAAIERLNTAADYTKLVDDFGIRRNSPRFWAYSDWLHDQLRAQSRIEAGVLDYNRYENR
ncbi:MAG: fatty acid cis/trans isomerase [Spongiibacteraceae bacterium]